MNPVSVNPMAVVDLPLPEQVALLVGRDADHFGLSAEACADYGWQNALDLVTDVGPTLRYLCHGPVARADDDGAWSEELDLLYRAVDFAAQAGATTVYFTSGNQGKLLWEEAAERVAARLAPLADHGAQRGVRVAIENSLSIRSDISFTHTVRDAAALAAMAGASLCVDLYCCWGEAGLARTLSSNLDRIAMVQVSDMASGDLALPNRRVPGEGDLPVAALLQVVRDLGYQGLLDVELIGPEIDRVGPAAALDRALGWLRRTWPE